MAHPSSESCAGSTTIKLCHLTDRKLELLKFLFVQFSGAPAIFVRSAEAALSREARLPDPRSVATQNLAVPRQFSAAFGMGCLQADGSDIELQFSKRLRAVRRAAQPAVPFISTSFFIFFE